VEFGIRFTLVAGTNPTEKALNMEYVGAGSTPLAPGATLLGDNNLFRGAHTLELDYEGKLAAPPAAKLQEGTPESVVPTTAVNQHTVTKTAGWTAGVTSSWGSTKTGPTCSIGGSFTWTDTTANTTTIAERIIKAKVGFGNNSAGNTEADHSIHYLISSTAVSDGGDPVNLLKNDWYGFFLHSTDAFSCLNADGSWSGPSFWSQTCTRGSQKLDGKQKWPTDKYPTVSNWPLWTAGSAQTEGMAGYTIDSGSPAISR
jgi:hypothetical protein